MITRAATHVGSQTIGLLIHPYVEAIHQAVCIQKDVIIAFGKFYYISYYIAALYIIVYKVRALARIQLYTN